MKNVKLKSCAS